MLLPKDYKDILQYDFAAFIGKAFKTVDPGAVYLPNWHISYIAEYLEAARTSQINRLIINLPPRSLKSVCVSVAWPAWLIGHNPKSRIMAASYASSLSIKHSLDCRHVITSPWYKELFPDVKLSRDQNEKHKFVTSQRGYRIATSVGGSVTGEGGNYLIIDDPQNPAQAMNSLWRNMTNRSFDHTFASRLDDKKNGVIVLVMQRLHPQDLTGYLLAKGGWEHMSIPAVASHDEYYRFGAYVKHRKPGELLHVDRENEALIARAKIELGSAAFSAQYQQKPISDEGSMIRKYWIKRYEKAPADYERIVMSWDTGIKAGGKNDPTVCLTFAEKRGASYLLNVQLKRMEYPELKRFFMDVTAQVKPDSILIEDKSSGQQLIQDMNREAHLPIHAMKPRNDKVTRFAAVTALIEAGRLFLPEQAAWLADFENELFSFPNTTHDDQVDALSQYLDWIREKNWDRLKIRRL